MSFRKRNIALGGSTLPHSQQTPAPTPGTRLSPLDGRLTTSTGTHSLDTLLGGHAGLVLGNSLLIEEDGTTDFAGALLRFYAAEGIVQGHQVHLVGLGEQWIRDLPGLMSAKSGGERKIETASGSGQQEKMKIAWRYERLGEFGTVAASRAPQVPNRNPTSSAPAESADKLQQYCHSFDLTKRLVPHPGALAVHHIPVSPLDSSPFSSIIRSLSESLVKSAPHLSHRVVIPTLLSPAFYAPSASDPTILLPFLHNLRALLRTHQTRLTVLISLPLALHPRSTGLTRWIEHLSDGVLELAPFPYTVEIPTANKNSSGSNSGDSEQSTAGADKGTAEEKAQGMLKIHRLPVVSERGQAAGVGDDLAFSLGRKRFVIKSFHLPPVDGDQEAQAGASSGETAKLEF